VKRIVTWALALTFTLGLYAPGIAQAHVKVFPTTVTLKASDTRVEKGQRVTFSGALKADNRRCRKNKPVQITRNGNAFARTQTNNRGKYSVTKKVRKSGRYRANFGGFGPFGTHPHSHSCAPDHSRSVWVRTQR
jgi:hypothetical protein